MCALQCQPGPLEWCSEWVPWACGGRRRISAPTRRDRGSETGRASAQEAPGLVHSPLVGCHNPAIEAPNALHLAPHAPTKRSLRFVGGRVISRFGGHIVVPHSTVLSPGMRRSHRGRTTPFVLEMQPEQDTPDRSRLRVSG
eukprot:scaffold157075_cov31-Tisochrysis_lutea.AAC.2